MSSFIFSHRTDWLSHRRAVLGIKAFIDVQVHRLVLLEQLVPVAEVATARSETISPVDVHAKVRPAVVDIRYYLLTGCPARRGLHTCFIIIYAVVHI